MNHRWSAAAVILAFAAAAPAHAAAPGYSFIEAAYITGKIDSQTSEVDTEGVRAAVNVSVQDWLYFTGDYDMRDLDGTDSELRFASAGFGVHSLQARGPQLIGAVSYERLEADNPGSDFVDEGYGLLGGARIPLGKLEIQADYKYLDYGKLANGQRRDDARFRLTGVLRLTGALSFTAAYHVFEDFDIEEALVGLRLNFTTSYDK